METVKQILQKNNNGQNAQPKPTSALCAYERETKRMMTAKFGDINRFMTAMSPARQIDMAQNREDSIVGDFPTLNNIATAYGRTAPIQWLIAQLINLSEFCGVKDKLTGDQCEELAWLLSSEYSYYKVTQFLVFFHDFKMGKFGKFYGSVDPLVITSAIRDFDNERVRIISKHEEENERNRREEESKNAITFQRYLEIQGNEEEKDCDPPQREKEEGGYDHQIMRQAKAIVENSYSVNETIMLEYRRLFIRNYDCTAEQYIDKFKSNSNGEKQNS